MSDKPKQKRRTKAQMEAARAAESNVTQQVEVQESVPARTRERRPMYGPDENSKTCMKCNSHESNVMGTYKAGQFYCRRRRCECGQIRITKEPLEVKPPPSNQGRQKG